MGATSRRSLNVFLEQELPQSLGINDSKQVYWLQTVLVKILWIIMC